MKTRTSTVALTLGRPEFNPADYSVENLACDNRGGFIAEAPPKSIQLLPSTVPAAVKKGVTGDLAFFINNRSVILRRPDGESELLGTLHGEPLTVADVGSRLIFMTSAGPWTVHVNPSDDSVTALGPAPRFPAVTFIAGDKSGAADIAYEVTTEPFKLTGGYTRWTGPLADADRRRVNAIFSDAYAELVRRASAAGHYVAPVMVWTRVVDSAGQLLHRSVPVMLSPKDYGSSLPVMTATVNRADGAFSSIDYASISGVKGFYPCMVMPERVDSPWNRMGLTLEVWMSPQLERVDFSGDCAVTFAGSTASSASLRVTAPLIASHSLMYSRMLDRLEKAGSPVMSIRNPFSGSAAAPGTVIPLPASGCVNAREAQATLGAMLAKKPDRPSPLTFINAPHSFTAAASCVAGDTVAWAAITPLHALPPGVADITQRRYDDRPWAAVTRVTLRHVDGTEEILSTEQSGSSGSPLQLSALAAYPHPAAVSMSVEVTDSSGTRRLVIPLTATEGGAWAVNLNFAREWSSAGVALSPLVRRAAAPEPGLLAAAAIDAPLSPVSANHVSPGDVKALTPAVSSRSSWDFARRHFYAFGSAGVHAVAVSAAARAITSHLVDNRPLLSRGAVTWSPGAVYAILGGRLSRIVGSSSSPVVDDDSPLALSSVLWAGGRLWCLGPGPSARVMDADGSWSTVTLPGSKPYRPSPYGAAPFIYNGSGVTVEPGISSGASAVAVNFRRRVNLARGGFPASVRTVILRLSTPAASPGGVDCLLSLEGDNGGTVPLLLASRSVIGAVAAPLVMPVPFACPFHWFTVNLSGSLPAGTRLEIFVDYGY